MRRDKEAETAAEAWPAWNVRSRPGAAPGMSEEFRAGPGSSFFLFKPRGDHLAWVKANWGSAYDRPAESKSSLRAGEGGGGSRGEVLAH